MTTPHQWAAEIHAIADGKEVEGRNKNVNSPWAVADKNYNPLTYPNDVWRIKPEKQVLRYRVAKLKENKNHAWLYFALNDNEVNRIEKSDCFVEWLHDWQEVEVE